MRQLDKINGPPTAREYNELVKRVNILSKIRGANGVNVIVGPGGVNITTKPPITELAVSDVRRAKTQAAGGVNDTILCKLYNSAGLLEAETITVHVSIAQGSSLNNAMPFMFLSTDIFVASLPFTSGSRWYCLTVLTNMCIE